MAGANPLMVKAANGEDETIAVDAKTKSHTRQSGEEGTDIETETRVIVTTRHTRTDATAGWDQSRPVASTVKK